MQRNLEVMNVLYNNDQNGPVLKVQRKQIALTSREKRLEEKVNFLKNKETRWAFSPRLEKREALSQALQ